MALGMTNSKGLIAYKANRALILAEEAKEEAEQGGGNAVPNVVYKNE